MSFGILCPGQGAQHPGMLDLIADQAPAEQILRFTDSVIGTRGLELLAPPSQLIYDNRIAQPLICAVQIAIWTILRPLLPPVCAFAGYSIGELTAYGCAEAIDTQDVIRLARDRAVAMDESCLEPCRMIAVRGLRQTTLDSLVATHQVHVAVVQEHDSVVIGGRAVDIESFSDAACALGARPILLPVYVASHTPYMRSATVRLRALLYEIKIAAPIAPVLAGIDGTLVRTRDRIVATLAAQVSTPLDWPACVLGLIECGCSTLLELGPGNELTSRIRRSYPELRARSVCEFRTFSAVANWVHAGITAH